MAHFFDTRAATYDRHMRENVDHFEDLYRAVAQAIAPTTDPIRILDLGCGTGLELPLVFQRAPNATVTGIDLSAEMLARLRSRFTASTNPSNLLLVQGSYLDLPLGEEQYDVALSVMSLHHLLPDPKRILYRKIHRALVPGGYYVEGEWIVSPEEEAAYLERYYRQASTLGTDPAGRYHLDIPFSLTTQQRLLHESGFSKLNLIWQTTTAAVYTGRKA